MNNSPAEQFVSQDIRLTTGNKRSTPIFYTHSVWIAQRKIGVLLLIKHCEWNVPAYVKRRRAIAHTKKPDMHHTSDLNNPFKND